jgi:hypothetical protein
MAKIDGSKFVGRTYDPEDDETLRAEIITEYPGTTDVEFLKEGTFVMALMVPGLIRAYYNPETMIIIQLNTAG